MQDVPFQCIYCNQRAVVSNGHSGRNILEFVESGLIAHSKQVSSSGRSGEIAFFGGTFTALPTVLLESILVAVSIPVEQGIFTGVRFSTRPDCLGDTVIDLLSKYPIRTVELGVQSLSDSVLQQSRRGYDLGSVHDAVKRIRNKGWRLGVQLMAGLLGDTKEVFIESMRRAIEIAPDFLVSIQPLSLKGLSG